MKFIRYWEEGSEVMLHCALRMQQFILFHLANLVILYVFFFFIPAADNEGPMDECGLRRGRTQTLHRTSARLQRPQENRYVADPPIFPLSYTGLWLHKEHRVLIVNDLCCCVQRKCCGWDILRKRSRILC